MRPRLAEDILRATRRTTLAASRLHTEERCCNRCKTHFHLVRSFATVLFFAYASLSLIVTFSSTVVFFFFVSNDRQLNHGLRRECTVKKKRSLQHCCALIVYLLLPSAVIIPPVTLIRLAKWSDRGSPARKRVAVRTDTR